MWCPRWRRRQGEIGVLQSCLHQYLEQQISRSDEHASIACGGALHAFLRLGLSSFRPPLPM